MVNQLEINLLPLEFRRKKRDLSWLSSTQVVLSTIAVILVTLTLSVLYSHIVKTTYELESSVAQINEAVEKERPLLEKIKELEETLRMIEQRSDALRSIQVSRRRWVVLLEELSTALMPNTWITSITQREGKMDVDCVTWDFSEVAMYMLKLEQQTNVITGVSLSNISADKVEGEDAYRFSLVVNFDLGYGMETGVR
ncbi:MAG: PilN domain-containing protein [Fibromonadaceae bacterium]|jgi:type IV pilus assembly protein PilN|nr:PilN domain-containing protein [Fibromonadaceae bacterium]